MAFLVRCPFSRCRRPKRVDAERGPNGADPVCECHDCSVAFVAWVDSNGVPFAMELPPRA